MICLPQWLKHALKSCVTLASWSSLKNIGHSKITAAITLIPIIGYFLILNDYGLDLFSKFESALAKVIFDVDTASANTRFNTFNLKLVYLGLWCVGLAGLLFNIFCPRIIRNYRDDREFVESSVAVSSKTGLTAAIRSLSPPVWYSFAISGLDEARAITPQNAPSSVGAIAREVEMHRRQEWVEKNLDAMNLCFHVTYQIKDYSAAPLRLFLATLFISGSFLTIFPSITVFLRVLQSLF